MDADMVVTGDVAELFDAIGDDPVSVMQEQQRFEWPSVMGFNCEACQVLTPEFIDDEANQLFDLDWASSVGKLPAEWNHCVGYQEPKQASLYHYTQGIPCWFETSGLPEDEHWVRERGALTHTVPWVELMGNSVHAEPVLKRMLGRYVQVAE